MSGETLNMNSEAIEHPLAGPWYRFWARQIDVTWESVLVALAFVYLWPEFANHQVFARTGGDQLFAVAVLPFALFLDALVVSIFGNSPGKALAGIEVREFRGGRPTLGTLAERNGRLWYSGLALGFGMIALFTFAHAKRVLDRGDITSWDRFAGTRCTSTKSSRARLALAVIVGASLWVGLVSYAAYETVNMPERWAKEINSGAPVMLDEYTRLDGATVGPGQRLTLRYTLVDVGPDSYDLDDVATQLKADLDAQLRVEACKTDGFLPLLSEGTEVRYAYHDKHGTLVWARDVRQRDCR